MDKTPFKSKKFIAMAVGVITTMFIYTSGIGLLAYAPATGASIVQLATISIASIASVISLYAVGQSAVDWKINSRLNSDTQSKFIKKQEEIKKYEMKYTNQDNIDHSALAKVITEKE